MRRLVCFGSLDGGSSSDRGLNKSLFYGGERSL